MGKLFISGSIFTVLPFALVLFYEVQVHCYQPGDKVVLGLARKKFLGDTSMHLVYTEKWITEKFPSHPYTRFNYLSF